MRLTDEEQRIAAGDQGEGAAVAMRIVAEAGRLLGADRLVPIESSREAMGRFTAPHELVEIEGAQHGFAVHDDPQYLNPQSQEWQAFVIRTVAGWLTAES